MKSFFLPLCLLMIWMGGLHPASAQSSPSDKLWIRAFAIGPAIDGLFYEGEEGYVELRLQPFRPSVLTGIPDPGSTLPLYTKWMNPETGVEEYVVCAKARIPKGCQQLTFIVVPGGIVEGIRQYDAIVYDDSDDDFPLNSVRLINLSPYEVAARFGEEAFKTASGEFSVQPLQVDEKSRVFAVAGQLSSTGENYNLEKFFQGPVSVPAGKRLTMLTVYSLEGMRAYGYEVMQNAQGEDQPRYIVVQWLDRPLRQRP